MNEIKISAEEFGNALKRAAEMGRGHIGEWTEHTAGGIAGTIILDMLKILNVETTKPSPHIHPGHTVRGKPPIGNIWARALAAEANAPTDIQNEGDTNERSE